MRRFIITDVLHVTNARRDLALLRKTEARIMILYATRSEANAVIGEANKLGMTGEM